MTRGFGGRGEGDGGGRGEGPVRALSGMFGPVHRAAGLALRAFTPPPVWYVGAFAPPPVRLLAPCRTHAPHVGRRLAWRWSRRRHPWQRRPARSGGQQGGRETRAGQAERTVARCDSPAGNSERSISNAGQMTNSLQGEQRRRQWWTAAAAAPAATAAAAAAGHLPAPSTGCT